MPPTGMNHRHHQTLHPRRQRTSTMALASTSQRESSLRSFRSNVGKIGRVRTGPIFIRICFEQQFGFVHIGGVHLLSGSAGNILSTLFIQEKISVDAAGLKTSKPLIGHRICKPEGLCQHLCFPVRRTCRGSENRAGPSLSGVTVLQLLLLGHSCFGSAMERYQLDRHDNPHRRMYSCFDNSVRKASSLWSLECNRHLQRITGQFRSDYSRVLGGGTIGGHLMRLRGLSASDQIQRVGGAVQTW